MLRPEPRHTPFLLILHLDRRVGSAHEALTYQIDAVADVRGGVHEWEGGDVEGGAG